VNSTPRDGTEILGREADGRVSLIAWCEKPHEVGYTIAFRKGTASPGWFRRAEGSWDLFDGFAMQEIEPVEWAPVPVEWGKIA
jgi:hypothetical protein